MERKDAPLATEQPAPTTGAIAIFAVVVALLFGGMYFFFPGNDRPVASSKSPAVAERPAPPVTTGQGRGTNQP
jgi:hypothetical protein